MTLHFCSGQLVINWMIIWMLQRDEELDPSEHSALSFVYPIAKLPSQILYGITERRLQFWLAIAGNVFLFLAIIVIFCLFGLNIYNPWCSRVVPVKTTDSNFKGSPR